MRGGPVRAPAVFALMRFYVNLPLRRLLHEPEKLREFLDLGLNPELGLDCVVMDAVNAARHREQAAAIRDHGARVGLHLPFFDLQPGSIDPLIRQACRERLAMALETARIYEPDHLVGHVAYDWMLYMYSYEAWRDRAVETWMDVLALWPEHPPLCMENTFETDPGTVAGFTAALKKALPAQSAENVGLCLDIGHWHSFAQGRERDNLSHWLETFRDDLKHLHLHDNDGSFDQHLGPGKGLIDFEALYRGLDERGIAPTVTFEPHTRDDLDVVKRYTAEHPRFA